MKRIVVTGVSSLATAWRRRPGSSPFAGLTYPRVPFPGGEDELVAVRRYRAALVTEQESLAENLDGLAAKMEEVDDDAGNPAMSWYLMVVGTMFVAVGLVVVLADTLRFFDEMLQSGGDPSPMGIYMALAATLAGVVCLRVSRALQPPRVALQRSMDERLFERLRVVEELKRVDEYLELAL